MDKLVVTRRGDKVCTAVVSDGKISQLMLEPDTADSLLGNIYIGKVQKVVSNINAAFIDIGPGCTGYYSLQERWKPERLKTGDELVVQVSKDAVKSKAPVVTERLSFTGRYCVLTVGKTGIGFSAKSVMPPTKPGFAGFWNVTWPELRTWALLSGPMQLRWRNVLCGRNWLS